MEEKKQVKLSLGITICIFIIILLIIALFGVVYYYNKKESNDIAENNNSTTRVEMKEELEPATVTEISEDEKEDNNQNTDIFNALSIDTATKKIVDDEIVAYYINKQELGLNVSVREGKVYFTTEMNKKQLVEYEVVSNENEVKTSENFEKQITGFDKKVIDAEIACMGNAVKDCFIVFLMEDGTLEYSTIKNLVMNLKTEGKVNNISNIQKIHTCSVGWYDGGGRESIVALDYENNLYDIGYVLFNLNNQLS